MMDIRLFAATKAFIVHNGKVLVLRESSKYADGMNNSRYDVVGGRVTPGERFDECLIREINEETGLSVRIGRPFFVNEWRPTVRGEQWHIIGTFFECFSDTDTVQLSEDHDHYKWIDPATFEQHGIIDNLKDVFESYNNLKSTGK